MKDFAKISAIIATEIKPLADITIIDEQIWSDDDIEAIMKKHDLSVDETLLLMRAVIDSKRFANAAAVKAADAATSKAADVLDMDFAPLYDDIWHSIYTAAMNTFTFHLGDIAADFIDSVATSRKEVVRIGEGEGDE